MLVRGGSIGVFRQDVFPLFEGGVEPCGGFFPYFGDGLEGDSESHDFFAEVEGVGLEVCDVLRDGTEWFNFDDSLEDGG